MIKIHISFILFGVLDEGIWILRENTLFWSLEGSRRHQNERDGKQPQGMGARPNPWAVAQLP